MRKILPGLLILAAVLVAVALGARSRPRTAEAERAVSRARISTLPLRTAFLGRLDSLDAALRELAAAPGADSALARPAFRHARAAYKRIEYLIEFDNPFEALPINLPLVETVDEDDRALVRRPAGLQVIEAALFPRPAATVDSVVSAEVGGMRLVLNSLRQLPIDTLEPETVPYDAVRSELVRVTTLGLAGFDATLSRDGLRESAAALQGMRDGLEPYRAAMQRRDAAGWMALTVALDTAGTHLEAAPDFDRFDRVAFLGREIVAIAGGLDRLRRALDLKPSVEAGPLFPNATNVYARGAIDAAYFAPDYAPPSRPELVALGRRLFFDPSLSSHRRRSCATCHQPDRAFTDGVARALVDPGHGHVRNTPTLLNAAFQAAQFADQRAAYLEFQVYEVLKNPREMGLEATDAASRLREDSTLAGQFAEVFGKPRSEAITDRTLTVAVAAYVRSLQALESRFDRAVQGDTAALTAGERRGFDLFMGKAACGTCHFAPLFGGSLPPVYRQSEPEVIGVPRTRRLAGARVDPDLGVFAITHAPLHRHAFKTPTLRNVAITPPYMHNGVFRTLEEVVEFYDRGGGNGLGMHLPNQTLSPEPLHLSEEEKRDLVAFLKALTDSASAPTVATR